jgi:hypothetical protein
MQLRPAATLHHARYRGGFHSAVSLAAAQAGVKFAGAHNTLLFSEHKTETTPFSLHPAKLPTDGIKCQGYNKRSDCVCFSAVLRP